ncbi:MAG: AbrB family transcriptional regulator [Oscillospiraceae bacterium]|nr:AbrB family transcriptional regulator [Oscillospiraceae bacterium]
MVYAIIAHVIGLTGGMLAKKRAIPAGALLGSIAFVFAFNLISGIEPNYPPNLRLVIQVLSGVLLGTSFARSDLFILRRLIKPVLIIVGMFMSFNVIFALILARFTVLEPTTAMLASAPGGIFDMAIIAIDFGADSHNVALLQIFRFTISVSVFPVIVLRLLKHARFGESAVHDQSKPADTAPKQTLTTQQKVFRLTLTVLSAGAGSMLFRWMGIPAGGILGAVTGAILISAVAQKAYFPKSLKPIVQAIAGGFVGAQFSMATISALRGLVLPMVIITIQLLLMSFSTAWVIRRFTGMDMAHSLFSCVPGGIAEMGILAGELGLRVPDIVLVHIIRLISVIFMVPILLSLFFG